MRQDDYVNLLLLSKSRVKGQVNALAKGHEVGCVVGVQLLKIINPIVVVLGGRDFRVVACAIVRLKLRVSRGPVKHYNTVISLPGNMDALVMSPQGV